MSALSKRIALVLSFLLMLPAIAVVTAPPPIHVNTPTISPTSPGPNDQVTVNVTVTPSASVQNVTLSYTTDSWRTTNTTVIASYNSTGQWAIAHIPALQSGGVVKYYIVAFNNNNNKVVNDNGGNYYSYTVPAPPTSSTTSMWIEIAVVLVAIGAVVSVAFYSFRPKTTKAGSN